VCRQILGVLWSLVAQSPILVKFILAAANMTDLFFAHISVGNEDIFVIFKYTDIGHISVTVAQNNSTWWQLPCSKVP